MDRVRDAGKIIGFSFNWRIENFSLCLHNKKLTIDSPVFRVKQCLDTIWKLMLYLPGDDEENITLNLCRCEDGLKDLIKITDTDVRLFISKTDGSCVFTDRVGYYFLPRHKYKQPLALSRKTVSEDSITYLIKDTLTVGFNFFVSSEPSLLANVPVECNARSKLIWTEYRILLPLKFPEMYSNSEYFVTSPLVSTSTEHPEFQFELHFNDCDKNENPVTITTRMVKSEFRGFLQCKMSFLNKEVNKYTCNKNYVFESELDESVWSIDISKEIFDRYSIYSSICLECELRVSAGKFTSILENTTYKQEIPDAPIKNCFNMSHLQTNLIDMYENEILCDFKVIVSGREFSVHKTVLSAVSPFFRAKFESGMAEPQVTIEEFSVDAVEKFLEFSYSDTVKYLKWNAALELYCMADKYKIQKLKTLCSTFFESNLSAETVPDLIALADLHEDSHLSKIAERFICNNSKAVFQSDAWGNFMKTNVQPASETMHRICKLFSEMNINPLI